MAQSEPRSVQLQLCKLQDPSGGFGLFVLVLLWLFCYRDRTVMFCFQVLALSASALVENGSEHILSIQKSLNESDSLFRIKVQFVSLNKFR